MGHNTLGVIPGTRKWSDVVALLEGHAASERVAAASATAAERELLEAAHDPVFVEAVRLLLSIPYAARSEDFGLALRKLDIEVGHRPELMDLISGVSERLDRVARTTNARNDLGELASRSLIAALATTVGDQLPGLFGPTPEDVQVATRKLGYSKGIARLSRDFFGRLVGETRSYWLDRVLANNVGSERRFADVSARSAFDSEISHLAVEASRIIQEFSGGWYGKTVAREGGVNSRQAAEFGAVALKKIVEELRYRDKVDA